MKRLNKLIIFGGLVLTQAISYVETTEDIPNPGRGFYNPKCISYSVTGNKVDTYAPSLYHMRLDISKFAASYNDEGKDIELSEDMLNALDGTLDNLEKKHSCAIIRFAYDPSFGGKDTIHEPSIEMINKHQEQLGKVLSKHEKCIVSVEVGLFGKWGEMHSGDKCSADNFNKAISKWLEVLPEDIPISVRTPGYYADWAGVNRAKLDENVTVKGTDAYRVGIYNDGYLGSYDDSGTYAKRDVEIAWLNNQAKHTLYGGEIVLNDNKGTVKNTAAYMETEAFTTHTSYLNIAWNDKVIAAMKEEKYSGKDPLYKGKTGFEYIRNHLGYRFVVRGVKIANAASPLEDFSVEADIENVGFANVVKDKKAILILKNDNNTYYILLDKNTVDPNKWDSKQTTKVNAVCDLPDDMVLGDYKVYLRVASDTNSRGEEGYPIRFANEDMTFGDTKISMWDKTLGANYLGNVNITESKPVSQEMVEPVAQVGNEIVVVNPNNEKIDLSVRVTSVDRKKGTGTVTVVRYNSTTKTVKIDDTFNAYGIVFKVTAIADKACVNNKKATNVIIGKNVKKIGKQAFYGLTKCKKLTIKSPYLTSKRVGKKAFGKMNKKIKVVVPKKKLKSYKKWIYKKGLSKKAKIVKGK
ncbi:MAG: DUF4832 domain-containing protein [Lachnospiraceae bacterium]|nr:DUF4832 domain-containing protein [Lachnospiraceae bacterium]